MSAAHGASRQVVLLVEGHSERAALSPFLHRWLDPQLPAGQRVGLSVVRFEGISNYLDDVAQKTAMYLEKGAAQSVFGLVDLYGLPAHRFDFSRCATVAERVAQARSTIGSLIPQCHRARFRQHFAVHEFEAWLLAYPDLWPSAVRGQIARRPPEEVNFDEPPARFLRRLMGRSYKKTVQARNILSRADPRIAVEKCPHLRELAEDLLRVAREIQRVG